MTDKINVIKQYLNHFPESSEANQKLRFYTYLQKLGIECNNSYYPRMDGHYLRLNEQMFATEQHYSLTNSTTKYIYNEMKTIIVWRAHSGKLDFVSDEFWWNITDEWDWFMNVLKSYNPFDYDEINNTFLYDIEDGKKLYND